MVLTRHSMNTATILYMTGTGNTARAVKLIANELSHSGWRVDAFELRRGSELPREASTCNFLVLAFPVLAFGMPTLVRTLARALRGKGRPAAVFATWGGDPFAALWLASRFLRRKGFRVVSSGGASYPFQWTQMVAPTSQAELKETIERGDAEVHGFARDLLGKMSLPSTAQSPHGTPKQGASPRPTKLLIGLTVSLLYEWIGRFVLGSLFTADARCKGCGACTRDCPAQAIRLAGKGTKRRPRWGLRCQGCNRCINLCPRHAIQTSPVRTGVHLGVNAVLLAALVIACGRTLAALHIPGFAAIPAVIILCFVFAAYGSRAQVAALEPVLFALEGVPWFRQLVGSSWTSRFSRYRCDGFDPRSTTWSQSPTIGSRVPHFEQEPPVAPTTLTE
jgi:ferredoxin